MRIDHTELSRWRRLASPPLHGKPRTKVGREWLRLAKELGSAVEGLEELQAEFENLDRRTREAEERLRQTMATAELTMDPDERRAAEEVAAELDAELSGLRAPRDFDREADVATRVCRTRAKVLQEFLRDRAADLLGGEVAPVAHEAKHGLDEWLAHGPEAEMEKYAQAEQMAIPLLQAVGLNGRDIPSFDLARLRSEIERLRGSGVPYPLPRSFFDADGEVIAPS